jgi:hypothetical protein
MADSVYSGTLWHGSIWYNGQGSPQSATGIQNDYYLDTGTNNVYTKTGSGWVLIANFSGPQGPQGQAGPQGLVGVTGATGLAGVNGTNGSRIYTGTGAPSNSLGTAIDLYVDTSAANLYSRAGGTWALVATLQGPQGVTGATGATGSAGAGFPTGGSAGQILKKNSSSNYDTTWYTLQASDINTALGYTPVGTTTASAVTITNTNASTNQSTGALIVAGGLGVSGNINTGSNVNIGGNATITGNLTVNGTTITVNSTTVTIQDPILTLGGSTAPAQDDGLDKGVVFEWNNGVVGKQGFFGYKRTTGKLTFIPDGALTNNVFSGVVGTIDLSGSYTEIRNAFTAGPGITINNGQISFSGSSVGNLQTVTANGGSTSSVINITNVTPTNSPTTGALTVAGGLGVGGDIQVNGNIYDQGAVIPNLITMLTYNLAF